VPYLTFSLPTFYNISCHDKQSQAGINLASYYLSYTVLSFDFYLGLLRGLK
jgi:hypothetical protein